MLRLDAIRVRNLRSLRDTGFLSLKPITILVGANSAGKSTFARVFPLLRQTIAESKRVPILWWGDLVDFGTFSTALNRDASPKEIEFGFRFFYTPSAAPAGLGGILRRASREPFSSKLVSSGILDAYLTIAEDAEGTYTKRILIEAFGIDTEIQFDESGSASSVTVGVHSWSGDGKRIFAWTDNSTTFPPITYVRRLEAPQNDGDEKRPRFDFHHPFDEILMDEIKHFVHGNTSKKSVKTVADVIRIGQLSDVHSSLLSTKAKTKLRVESLLSNGSTSPRFIALRDAAIAVNLNSLMSEINEELARYFLGVRYLQPVRATAQRYYRQQELAVGEIDSDGSNLAMFISGLRYQGKAALGNWLQKALDIKVEALTKGGHTEILITTAKSSATNIADMGFGFSQILPIAVQLWNAARAPDPLDSSRRTPATCAVIEQPELHLHPELQARIADLFVAATNRSADNSRSEKLPQISIVAETHSPALINRLGRLIADGALAGDDVQIILFEPEVSGETTNVRVATFDDEGILTNWPFGFFDVSPERA